MLICSVLGKGRRAGRFQESGLANIALDILGLLVDL